MSEDINVNVLAEAINDKMDRDAGNITSPMLPVFLVDIQYPTSENGYIWYRLYSDGWVEQGVGPRDLTSAVYTFTFPIPMQTSNYFVLTGLNDSLNTTAMAIKVTSRTTTSLQCRNSYQGSGSTINGWVEVKGMSALPAVNPIGLLENTMKKVVDGEGVVDTTKLNSAETSIASFLNI